MTTSSPPAGPGPAPAARRRPGVRALLRGLLNESLVPETPIGRRLAVIALIDSLGSGMFYSGSALYFTTVVGLTEGQVGLGLSLAGLVGFLAAVPIGMAADRFRAGRVYVALQLWRGLCYTVYCFTNGFPMFLVAASGIGLADTAVQPINVAVVGAAVDDKDRVDTLAKVRAVRNIGFGGGALIAAAAIQQGTAGAFTMLIAGNAVSFGVAALMLWLAGVTRLVSVGASTGKRPGLVADARYIGAAILNGLLAMHLTLLPLALPLWLAGRTDIPVATFGLLYLLNTVLAVLLQARFARPARTLGGAVRCARYAGLALAGFALAMHVMAEVGVLWLAIALAFAAAAMLTFGELWQSASGWTISYELARPDKRAQYLSTYQLGTSLQAVVAPWLITAIILPASGGWIVFAIVIAIVGYGVRAVIDDAPVVPTVAPGT